MNKLIIGVEKTLHLTLQNQMVDLAMVISFVWFNFKALEAIRQWIVVIIDARWSTNVKLL